MKLLFYNWADCYGHAGGGVTVYLKSLLGSGVLGAHDVSMLSSGYTYTLGRRVHWRELKNAPDQRVPIKRYEIVNSRLMAPAIMSFGNAHELNSPEDTAALLDFMQQKGPFDIVHFHNLEGLSLEAVRALREHHPEMKLVFSMHNYFPFCSQVNLFLEEDSKACRDFRNGEQCGCKCRPRAANVNTWQQLMRIFPFLVYVKRIYGYGAVKWLGIKVLSLVRGLRSWPALGATPVPEAPVSGPAPAPEPASQEAPAGGAYRERRAMYVDALAHMFDLVICVSDRVREIALGFGLDPNKTVTEYIGTSMSTFVDTVARRTSLPAPGQPFVLTYLGYTREDKGYYFLLDALEALKPELAGKITIQLAAIGCLGGMVPYVRKKCHNLGGMLVQNGYKRDQLSDVLKQTTLGVVPVIWEDCLPQVAIEMHCHGVPLLCSDMGGARELAHCDDFVFKAGDPRDFAAKLEKIVSGEVPLARYWEHAMRPLSMEAHTRRLVERYQALVAPALRA